jgi:hypothetical protein
MRNRAKYPFLPLALVFLHFNKNNFPAVHLLLRRCSYIIFPDQFGANRNKRCVKQLNPCQVSRPHRTIYFDGSVVNDPKTYTWPEPRIGAERSISQQVNALMTRRRTASAIRGEIDVGSSRTSNLCRRMSMAKPIFCPLRLLQRTPTQQKQEQLYYIGLPR